ncbi:zinc finger, CCHC-type containing protein [Tanacetum coccineum]
MAAAAMKHMASNFVNLDKFKRVEFRIWQKKMHFLVSSMSVVYMLTSPILEEGGDDATADQIRKRAKWDNDDYACRDSSESKYVAEDALSKKLLVSNFTIYKMTDSRPVMEHYNELLGILGRFTQHKINMDKAIQVSCIIDKLPPSWKDFKHTLKHKKEELTLVELGSHLRIDESPKVPDSDKPKSKNVTGPSVVNMKCDKTGHIKRDCKGVNVGNKANGSSTKGSMDGSSNLLKGATVHVYLKFSSGKIVSLFNVFHVPNIRKNLVSSSILNNYGYKQVIKSKNGVFIGFGYLSNQMFRLNIVNDNIASAFMSTSKLNDLISWHARLDHVHFKRMQDLSKDGLIPAFDMDTEKCKTCMLTKITKKPFQNVKCETEVLELLEIEKRLGYFQYNVE